MKRTTWIVTAVAVELALAALAGAEGVSPPKHQLAERQRRMFRDAPDRQVARFLIHPYQPTVNAAAAELASRGERVAPLMIVLLGDELAALRAGAVKVLARLYHYDGETFRAIVDNGQLAEALGAIAPLIDDPDNEVRRAVIGFVDSVRVDSPATRRILRRIATTPDVGTLARIQGLLRYQIEDPALRVELARLSAETLLRMPHPNPGSLKVLPICATAHVEACRPLIPACLDLLETHALTMWGMFSDSPTQAAMQILEFFADDPRVRAGLPSILRLYTRKVGGKNGYWIHLQEGPRRILLRMGPAALPTLKAFCRSERKVFADYASGARTPANAWAKLWPGAELRFEELDEVATLIEAVYGPIPVEDAVPVMCRIYLQRDWSEVERQRIRNRLVELGPPAASLIRRHLSALTALATDRVSKQIVAWKATDDPARLKALGREITPLEEHLGRIDALAGELADVATLIETVAGRPGPSAVRTFCRLYTRRAWAPQRELLRNTLHGWGLPAAKGIRQFIAGDKPYAEACMARLDAQEAHSRATLRFGRGLDGALVRVELDRAEVRDTYARLADLASVIEWTGPRAAPAESVPVLCRIYADRGWHRQNESIATALERTAGADALAAGIRAAEARLAKAVEQKRLCLGNTVKSRYRWRYDLARAAEANLRAGIAGLKAIAARRGPAVSGRKEK